MSLRIDTPPTREEFEGLKRQIASLVAKVNDLPIHYVSAGCVSAGEEIDSKLFWRGCPKYKKH